MTIQLDPDLCVIGGGSAGLTVAAAAAAFGVPVVLVERARMGGDCLNHGCVPSKALIAAARRAHAMRTPEPFGIAAVEPEINFAKVMAHVREVIAGIAPTDSVERFSGLGVKVVEAEARFVNRHTVVAGDYTIRARRFVIATGSSPAVPEIPGLDKAPYLTNETVFDLKKRPEHLLVLGGGPIGMELGQAFRRLGSQVTIVEAATPLGREDPEMTGPVLEQFAREGIAVRAGASVVRIGKSRRAIQVVLGTAAGEEILTGTHLLVATGRTPNIEGLGLEAAGVRHGERGIRVGRRLVTSNGRIYAIGDVIGGAQFTHAANYHAGLVVRNALFRLPVRARTEIVPSVTFTDPEIARVGLDEAAARKAAGRIRILRWPYHENDRARTERDARGHVKIVADRRGRVLGAAIVGADAGELILPFVSMVARRARLTEATGTVVPYPTRGEIGRRAAIGFFTPGLTNPWVQRIIRFLRKFG